MCLNRRFNAVEILIFDYKLYRVQVDSIAEGNAQYVAVHWLEEAMHGMGFILNRIWKIHYSLQLMFPSETKPL